MCVCVVCFHCYHHLHRLHLEFERRGARRGRNLAPARPRSPWSSHLTCRSTSSVKRCCAEPTVCVTGDAVSVCVCLCDETNPVRYEMVQAQTVGVRVILP